jgi:hypothetical protein
MFKSLHPMFLFEVWTCFGGAFAFCGWMLWDLRKENRLAAAKKAEAERLRAVAGEVSHG